MFTTCLMPFTSIWIYILPTFNNERKCDVCNYVINSKSICEAGIESVIIMFQLSISLNATYYKKCEHRITTKHVSYQDEGEPYLANEGLCFIIDRKDYIRIRSHCSKN